MTDDMSHNVTTCPRAELFLCLSQIQKKRMFEEGGLDFDLVLPEFQKQAQEYVCAICRFSILIIYINGISFILPTFLIIKILVVFASNHVSSVQSRICSAKAALFAFWRNLPKKTNARLAALNFRRKTSRALYAHLWTFSTWLWSSVLIKIGARLDFNMISWSDISRFERHKAIWFRKLILAS